MKGREFLDYLSDFTSQKELSSMELVVFISICIYSTHISE